MTNRPPTPGEVLKKEFFKPRNLTQKEFAIQIGWNITSVHRLLNEHAGLGIKSCYDLSKFFGTSMEFWAQIHLDYAAWFKNCKKGGH